ncbi:MAG: ABC transporter permease [Verrucomicrobia bacterium]|nr:ABC transporter permease [Verrucomicrobiota bacterium]
MFHVHYSRFLVQRIAFLVVGNVLLLLAIFVLVQDGGSFADVILNAAPNVAPTVLAGLGLTGIICAGAIDLSVGSIIAVAGTVFGVLVHRQVPPFVCYAGCVATAWCLSVLNGYLVRGLGISAIIVTLAGLAFYRGLALILADSAITGFGGNISIQDDAYHSPGKVYAGAILILTIAAAGIWENSSKTPSKWLALGNSEEACRLAGLSSGRILQTAYGAGGVFLGLAALIYVTRIQAIEPARIALGFELQVIGAVILGGTNIFGGEGRYIGTVLGSLFLYLLSEFLVYAGVNPYFQEVVAGAIILFVIGLDCAMHRKRKMLEEVA